MGCEKLIAFRTDRYVGAALAAVYAREHVVIREIAEDGWSRQVLSGCCLHAARLDYRYVVETEFVHIV